MSAVSFKSWSASRWDDYSLCPHKAMHKHLLKTCPHCFKGTLKGKFGEDPVCTFCRKTPVKGAPLVRGGVIGKTLELYVAGEAASVHEDITNKAVLKIAKKFRAGFAKGKVEQEEMHKFDRNWRHIPGEGWSPDAWVFVKMDVCEDVSQKVVKITDWKTGGCDRAGAIKVQEKYDDQLATYKVAGLVLRPKAERAESALCFVDAKGDPIVDRGPLLREGLEKEQKRLAKLVLPMMEDRVFAPRSNSLCPYCDYSKTKGGPCKF